MGLFRIQHCNFEQTFNSTEFDTVHTNEDEDGDEGCYYDKVEERNNLNNLMSMDLNDIENKILANILNGSTNLKFDAALYNCSIEEFNDAIDGLRDKMSIAGLE